MAARAGAARSHVERIMRCVDLLRSAAPELEPAPPSAVAASWRRCVVDYGLNPLDLGKVDILPEADTRLRAQAVEELLPFARGVISTLSAGLQGGPHTVLLADAEGVVLHRLGDLGLRERPARAGIEPGAVWDERRQGTNGIGTSIAARETTSIYLRDHFAPGNRWLACTSTPVRTPTERILGALNVTLLGPPQAHRRALVEHLLETAARRVEDMLLLSRLRTCWIVGLTSDVELAGIAFDGLLAIDDCGQVAGANDAARRMFQTAEDAPLIGRPLDRVLGLSLENILRDQSGAGAAAIRLDHTTVYATARAPVRPYSRKPPAPPATTRPGGPPHRGELSLADIAGDDPVLGVEIGRLRRFIDRKIPIVIGGETGTGKEALAKAIHRASSRAAKPFVAINCAAIPETLIESELFGYADGAFTGASRRGLRGKVVQASGGTLFLDEIGDMPIKAQTRLLRVIAEQEVYPLGSNRPVCVDLHVVCASHQDIEALTESGRFRADLLYRLTGATITMPALRDRADKVDLIERVLEREAAELGLDARLDGNAALALARYRWPGNMRQLRHLLRAAIVASPSGVITQSELPPSLAQAAPGAVRQDRPAEKCPIASSSEASVLLSALRHNAWCVADTARALRLSRQALYRRMKRLGIVSPNRADAANADGRCRQACAVRS